MHNVLSILLEIENVGLTDMFPLLYVDIDASISNQYRTVRYSSTRAGCSSYHPLKRLPSSAEQALRGAMNREFEALS